LQQRGLQTSTFETEFGDEETGMPPGINDEPVGETRSAENVSEELAR